MTIQQLLDKRAGVWNQMEGLKVARGNDWKQEDQNQWDAMYAEYNLLTRQKDMLEQMETIASQNVPDPAQPAQGQKRTTPEEDRELMERRAMATFANYILRGDASIDKEGAKLLKELRKQGHSVLDWERRGTNVIATETTTTYGGYLVPVTLWTELERRMKLFGGMMQACRVINTDDGGLLNWPTNDDTAATGAWLAEPRSSALTVEDTTFSRVQYNSFTWGTLAKFTIEMFQDERVNLLMEQITDIFSERAGRALNAGFTTGSGTGRPTGLLTSTSAGKTAASATAITKAEIIDLVHSIDPAYRNGPNVGFMMNDAILGYIRKLDFGSTNNDPLWQPSYTAGVQDRLLGYPVYINQDMDSTVAATKKTMVFGDFSKYIIREVQRPSMYLMQERYMDELHKGLVMWCRYDGKLLNSNAIKHFLQS
jgi:HK97 family phage major capsid protein